jgi:replicative DNA helicase
MTAVNHNIPVGIFSLEMSSQQLVDRMLAAESRVLMPGKSALVRHSSRLILSDLSGIHSISFQKLRFISMTSRQIIF